MAETKEKKKRGIGRRLFLIGSGAVAGGVAFGVYWVRRPHANPLLSTLEEGEAAITPFVKITKEGVTLITPRADKGQGAYSTQAHLLAEELDVDPQKVMLDPGSPSPAYFNSAFADAFAPFAAFDMSWTAETVRDLMYHPLRQVGIQMTGGSMTVPDMYVRLREAGAVARETLKAAAAQKHSVPIDDLKTDNGAVILPDGKRVSYESLAETASAVPPVSNVKLREPSEWRYLGKKMQRIDMLAKSTGTQSYGIDLRFDKMLYATVRTNPGIGGKMQSYNASAAEKMRGVKKIVPIKNGVAVIADNTWRAFKAADAIKFEWGPAPYPATSAQMWEKLSEAVDNEAFQDSRMRNDGDVEAVQKDAEVFEAEYRTPFVSHAPLEPMNATVLVEEDSAHVWTGTQIPDWVRDHVAKLTGLPVESVLIYNQPMGGSFGRRLEDTYVLQAVEAAMQMKGTPIKMIRTREEDMAHDYPRPMQLGRLRGTVKDGKIESVDFSTSSTSMTRSWFKRVWQVPPGPDAALVLGAWDQPYGIPNYRVTGYTAEEMVPTSSWRAPGANNNGFFHESFLDELIEKAGADPLQARIAMCIDETSRRVLEKLGEVSNWKGSKPGPGFGRGLAFVHSHGVPVGEVVDVRVVDGAIKIEQAFLVADAGRVLDPINFEAQMTGGFIFGIGHAMNCELTYKDYKPQQTNYHAHEAMRLYQTPRLTTVALENNPKIRGIGEPCLPPAAPALANAIYAATGKRVRELPFNKSVKFV
ncbi:MAG: molybdopterin cofactor-binding domain-containing protein [Myxococcota bacterium]